ncbi:MAG: FtsW/RodA/SpoVE family cell cycle protein [Ruminococcus sp.]
MIRERKKETKTDTVLLILVLLLAVFGLVMLFSISEYNGRVRFGDSAYYFKKQLFATALGLMTMYIVAETDYRFFVRLAPAAYLLSMGLSTAVLFVGQEINGSRRWLNFGPLSFQPSEFAKAAVILFLTWQIQGSKKTTAGFWFMCRTMLTLLPIVGLVGSNNSKYGNHNPWNRCNPDFYIRSGICQICWNGE